MSATTRLSSSYSVTGLSPSSLSEHVRKLTFRPVDRSGLSDPPPLPAYTLTDGQGSVVRQDDAASLLPHPLVLSVPRFYGLSAFGPPASSSLNEGAPLSFAPSSFVGSLNEAQTPVLEAVLRAFARGASSSPSSPLLSQLAAASSSSTPLPSSSGAGGILVLPCGFGKTVLALRIAAEVGKRCLVMVHKSFLLEQWRERISTFLPEASVGVIRQDKAEVEGKDIVLGMIQTVVRREVDLSSIGLALYDECHHMAAPVFFAALGRSAPRFLIGLTATEERGDGLTSLLTMGLGPILFRVEGRGEDDSSTRVRIVSYRGPVRDVARADPKPGTSPYFLPLMLKLLSQSRARNRLLARLLAEAAFGRGRRCLVLSSTLAHLDAIRDALGEEVETRGWKRSDEEEAGGSTEATDAPTSDWLSDRLTYFVGSSTRSQREAAHWKPVVLATYAMAKEGLDIPTLDCLLLATPSSSVEQAVGRVQRPCAGKASPEVIDIVDVESVAFSNMAKRRGQFYRKRGMEVREE